MEASRIRAHGSYIHVNIKNACIIESSRLRRPYVHACVRGHACAHERVLANNTRVIKVSLAIVNHRQCRAGSAEIDGVCGPAYVRACMTMLI